MTYNIGDGDHIGVHNTLASDVGDLAARVNVEVDLPPQRNLGELGHTDDHNLIQAALDTISAAATAPIASFRENSSTNGVFSIITDGSTMYQLIRYDQAGLLTVTQDGYAEVLIVAGGGGGAGNHYQYSHGGSGAGGPLYKGSLYFPTGDLVITVGAGGNGGPAGANIPNRKGYCGGSSIIENVITIRGNNEPGTQTPLTDDTFTGNSSPGEYGMSSVNYQTNTNPGGGGGGAQAAAGNTTGYKGTPGVVLIRTEWNA